MYTTRTRTTVSEPAYNPYLSTGYKSYLSKSYKFYSSKTYNFYSNKLRYHSALDLQRRMLGPIGSRIVRSGIPSWNSVFWLSRQLGPPREPIHLGQNRDKDL